jgi:hypothetical protein
VAVPETPIPREALVVAGVAAPLVELEQLGKVMMVATTAAVAAVRAK